MKREEKIKKRIERSIRRHKKHNQKYFDKIIEARDKNIPSMVSLSRVRYGHAYWQDSSSPTGYMQVCSYQGWCQFPCNGDC